MSRQGKLWGISKRRIGLVCAIPVLAAAIVFAEDKPLTAPVAAAPKSKSAVLTAPGGNQAQVAGAITAPTGAIPAAGNTKVLSAPSGNPTKMGRAPVVSKSTGVVPKSKAEVLTVDALDKLKRPTPSNLVMPSSPVPSANPK